MNTPVGARPDGTGGAQLVGPPEAKPKGHVFICYSSKDQTVADAACASLEARGVRCWIAPRDIRPGQERGVALLDALRESSLMVLVFSSNANESREVLAEVERAVRQGTPTVTLRIEDVRPSKSLEYFVSSRPWLDALMPPLAPRLAKLADTVKGMLGATSVS
jgi:TIR domain